jgi:hypothetical protein
MQGGLPELIVLAWRRPPLAWAVAPWDVLMSTKPGQHRESVT